jgi:hypothetical protein
MRWSNGSAHETQHHLGLDLGNRPTLVDDLKRSADRLQQLAAGHGIELQRR